MIHRVVVLVGLCAVPLIAQAQFLKGLLVLITEPVNSLI